MIGFFNEIINNSIWYSLIKIWINTIQLIIDNIPWIQNFIYTSSISIWFVPQSFLSRNAIKLCAILTKMLTILGLPLLHVFYIQCILLIYLYVLRANVKNLLLIFILYWYRKPEQIRIVVATRRADRFI